MGQKAAIKVLEHKDTVDELVDKMWAPLEEFMNGTNEAPQTIDERRLITLRAASFVWNKANRLVEASYLHNKLVEIQKNAKTTAKAIKAKATTKRRKNGQQRHAQQ